MTTLSKPKYPQRFTCFVAEVADTAMRAVQQPDPYDYVENWTKAEALQLARMHRGTTPQDHSDPVQRRAFRLEVVNARIVRDLALQVIASYDRLERLSGCFRNGSTIVPLSRAPAAIRQPLRGRAPSGESSIPRLSPEDGTVSGSIRTDRDSSSFYAMRKGASPCASNG